MSAYYNEIDPYAVKRLRYLISAGRIADGEVDERSIVDVDPNDLKKFTQCHFFAGIGGWSYAARLAGWPDDWPIWTGSCPCQPFSSAGKRSGTADARHLWPSFARLIAACRPPILMGEQVADAVGRNWLPGVQHDMEEEGYAFRPILLPACSVTAPHERNRLWFVADTDSCHSDWWTDLSRRKAEGRVAFDRPRQNARPWDGAIGTVDHRGVRRRTPLGVRMLGNGIPDRVDALRCLANAIVPQVGAAIIRSYMDVLIHDLP